MGYDCGHRLSQGLWVMTRTVIYEPGRWVVIRAVVYDKGHGLQLGP